MNQITQDRIFLFLDDIRIPEEAFSYTGYSVFVDNSWVVVRNYEEFTSWIAKNGLPHFVSFDHDLADSHYAPSYLWDDYEASKRWQDSQVHKEKTGYECAKWLVDYCIDNDLQCPNYFCHSMNPVGRDNIVKLLNKFNETR